MDKKERRVHEAALRKLRSEPADTIPTWARMQRWIVEEDKFPPSEDRSIILVAYASLEQALLMALQQHFGWVGTDAGERVFYPRGLSEQAPLGSVYARSALAEALDIFGAKTAQDIQNVNIIRNTFAHSGHPLDFGYQSLAALSQMQTTADLPAYYEMKTAKGDVVFRLGNSSPRSRILSFILYFDLFCRMDPKEPVKRAWREHRFV